MQNIKLIHVFTREMLTKTMGTSVIVVESRVPLELASVGDLSVRVLSVLLIMLLCLTAGFASFGLSLLSH